MATATTPSGGTSTTSFIYNALGERVQLVAPTYTYNYPFDAFGQEIGIHNSSSGWGHYTVDIAGRRIFLSGSATRWLFHPNVVGSSTMVTDQTGAVVQDATHYPWGQLWQSPGSFGGNWNFAAFGVLEPTTNLYPTPFRRYSSTQGRWTSPDPAGLGAANPANPQSWNRYAYVLNDPMRLRDPLGLRDCDNDDDPEDPDEADECDPTEPASGDDSNRRDKGNGGSGGSGGAQRSNTGSLKQNALNLDDCIKNNAANYSIPGVLSLVGNTDISNAGVLDNQVTGAALFSRDKLAWPIQPLALPDWQKTHSRN